MRNFIGVIATDRSYNGSFANTRLAKKSKYMSLVIQKVVSAAIVIATGRSVDNSCADYVLY